MNQLMLNHCFLKNALKLTESFWDYSLVFIKNVYIIAQRSFMLHKETTK